MIKRGIHFDDIHSYNDLNLILAPFVPIPAVPKTDFVDIVGGDGSLDMTEGLGEVRYKDRNFTFTFSVNPSEQMAFDEKVSQVSNALNGKRCKITLDRDPEYYWQGRCIVDKYTQNKNLKQISVKATVFPYKFKQNETVVEVALGEFNSIATSWKSVAPVNHWETIGYEPALVCEADIQAGKTYTVQFKCNTAGIVVRHIGAMVDNWQGFTTTGQLQTSRMYVRSDLADYKQYCYDTSIGGWKILLFENETSADVVFTDFKIVEGTDLATEKTVTLKNGRRSVVPLITCTDDNTIITFGSFETTLNAGTHKVLDIFLKEGNNILKVSGSGTTTFTYQEGEL